MFVMLYSPCFCTLVIMKKKIGKWRWVVFAMFYTTALAYFVAPGIRMVAVLFGWGVS
jgi:ferrous iron transport protein B